MSKPDPDPVEPTDEPKKDDPTRRPYQEPN
jgi:hypothetical protein